MKYTGGDEIHGDKITNNKDTIIIKNQNQEKQEKVSHSLIIGVVASIIATLIIASISYLKIYL